MENKAGAIAATMAIGGLIGGFGTSALTADLIIGSVALLAASALTYYTAGPILKSRRVEK